MTRRSFLDDLNAGRQRRTDVSLDRISRTLDELEGQLGHTPSAREEDSAPGRDDIMQRMQRLSDEAARLGRHRQSEAPPRASLEKLARDAGHARRQESEVASVGRIAEELKALREGLSRRGRAEPTPDIRRPGSAVDAPAGRDDGDFAPGGATPRSAPAAKAAGEGVGGAAQAQSGMPDEDDPAIRALGDRLEQIGRAVDELPESATMRSLEDRMDKLAIALDQLNEQSGRHGPDMYAMIEERLDEISRAIAASASAAATPAFDPEPFARIEARVASLAQQVEELVGERPSSEVGSRLDAISERVDDIARRVDIPRDVVARLADQMMTIADRLDTVSAAPDTEAIFRDLEDRFARLTEMVDKRQGDAMEESRSLFRELEQRLDAMTDRLDRQGGAAAAESEITAVIDARLAEMAASLNARSDDRPEGDGEGLHALERRLDDIAARLQDSAAQVVGMDAEIVRNLEAQVRSLSEHLSRPGRELPEFEDLGPRLDRIERSIAENREAVMEAAHRAAEEAIGMLGGSQPGADAMSGLADELKALETLTRRTDERNAKTFEAIHDTLLKIVDRLSVLEVDSSAPARLDDEEDAAVAGSKAKIPVEPVPSIAPSDVDASFTPAVEESGSEEEYGEDERGKRSPAEAAAAAAEAALQGDAGEDGAGAGRAKRSMLEGLTRAFASRREDAPGETRTDPPLAAPEAGDEAEAAEAAEAAVVPEPDPERDNEPLEPGSGAPDLNAIMRRVRDEQQPAPQAGSDAAKSDFIAAARRAAQAAAAEADMQKKRQSAGNGATARFSLANVLKGRKKALMLTAAVAVVLVGGMQFGSMMLSGETDDDRVEARSEAGAAGTSGSQGSPDAGAGEMLDTAALPDAAGAGDDADGAGPAGSAHEVEAGEGESADADGIATPDSQTDSETGVRQAGAADEESGPTARGDDGEGDGAGAVAAARIDDDAGIAREERTPAEPAQPEAADEESEAGNDEIALDDIPGDAGPVPLREAAAQGDPKAMFEIASRYADGEDGDADLAEAAQWYERAGEAGLAPAQYRIGNFHEKGMGVERDTDQAKAWYRRAAEQGNASAMHNLAVLHAMGSDGATDNETAARWFLAAAELGVTDSQFNLGILAAKGVGVEQDLEEAYKWFALVAESGDSDAAAKRDEVANALDEDQLERARAAAELWKPKTIDPETNVVEVPDEWREGDTTTASVDVGEAVSDIQRILNKNGYEAGAADGIMGEKTRSAIGAFQKDNDMEPTGEVDADLVRALLDKG